MTDELIPQRAVIYARHSPSNVGRRAVQKAATGDTDSSNSAERQVEVCRRYCELRGYTVAADPYVDADKSGKDPMEKRPGASAMLSFLRKRPQPATIVVMTELDRGWRDPIDAMKTSQEWGKAGISIHFASMGGNSIDTSTPIGEYVFGQLALFARLQRRQIGARTKGRMNADQRAGRRVSKHLPYGFKLDSDSPRIQRLDPKTGDIVECELSGMVPDWGGEMDNVLLILGMHSSGLSAWKIMKRLNDEGIPGRNGVWRYQTVKAIIRRGMPDPEKWPRPQELI
jgi:DNA invertase Pin-like site-specific DNA recombinase